MKPFTHHTGTVAPLSRGNVDTDAILPKQFLKKIGKDGYGDYLFHEWRYLEEGAGNPEFLLNQYPYQNASILLTKENFGCGSSREHAVWALSDYGFKAVISSSFADIFYNNCFKNGLLPVVLTAQEISELFEAATASKPLSLSIDLKTQTVTGKDGFKAAYTIEPFYKKMLMNGWDEIAMTLADEHKITEFESRHRTYFSL